ncbi:MAG: DNA polymerase III subunit beta [Lentisphaerae bacterium]|nr:DNA polymerase III subunit beta [Lentisphaerota bacterium]
MKFTVSREKLLDALKRVNSTVSSRNTLPILGNVLIEAENNQVVLTTTDLEIRISTRIEAEIEVAGSTTIPAKRLLSLVSKFEDAVVSISSDERYHAEVTCGTSCFKLLGIAPEDFPGSVELAPIRTITFKGAELKRMLGQIIYAITLNDSRKVLHGMLVSVHDNTVTMVATDSKRLAMTERSLENFSGGDGDCIIPLQAAIDIKGQADPKSDITLEVGDKMARFTTPDTVLTTKLIEGNYPNYRQVIPGSFTKQVTVATSALLGKIELVSQVLADSTGCIELKFSSDRLELRAASSDIGEGSAELPVEYSGEDMTASFNPVFLADPLRYADCETMTFKMNDGFSPVAIDGNDGFLYVIMPMRH